MKLVNINNTQKENKVWEMYAPIPESIEWHRLTGFREISKLALLNPELYENWKKRGWIPSWIIKRENESEYQG